MTGLVAISGYVREIIVASHFGAGTVTDAFFFGLVLVQTVHDLLFAGALTAAVIPLLHHSQHTGGLTSAASPKIKPRIIATLGLLVLLPAIFIALLLRFLAGHILAFAAPDLPAPSQDLALTFTDVLVWSIPANAVVTFFGLVLNAYHYFRLPSTAALVNNVVFIVALLILEPLLGPRCLPVAFVAGPVLNLGIMSVGLYRLRLLRFVRPDFRKELLSKAWRYSRPLLLSCGVGSTIGLLMVSQLIARSYAAGHGDGAISALGYAFRLYEVPISIIVNPAATIIFPIFAGMYVSGKKEEIADLLRSVLMWGLLALFPAAVLVALGAEPIVHLLLHRGKFNDEAARLTTEALRGFAAAIIFESAVMVCYRVFYAINKAIWTVWISLVSISILIIVLHLTRNGSFQLVPASVSFEFATASAAAVALLVITFGVRAMPPVSDLLLWAAAAGASVAVWAAVAFGLAEDLKSHLLALTAFCSTYLLAVLAVLPTQRKALSSGLRQLGLSVKLKR